MSDVPAPGSPIAPGQRMPRAVWTDGAGTRVEVIALDTQRGPVVAYKVTRGGLWLGDYQSPEELVKVVDLAALDEL